MDLIPQFVGNTRVIVLSGRLDQDNCEVFQNALVPHLEEAASLAQNIVLDLSQLVYLSSAGLRCFMLAARQAKAKRGRIVVAALQPIVAEIFQISRFDMVLQVFVSVEAALAALKAPMGGPAQ